MKTLKELQEEIRQINEENGWFDRERSFGDGMALLHSEVSEAFEAYRDHGTDDQTIDLHTAGCPGDHRPGDQYCPWLNGPMKPEGVGSELADVIIRVLDEFERINQDRVKRDLLPLDPDGEVERKLNFNRTRGFRHGNKRV